MHDMFMDMLLMVLMLSGPVICGQRRGVVCGASGWRQDQYGGSATGSHNSIEYMHLFYTVMNIIRAIVSNITEFCA